MSPEFREQRARFRLACTCEECLHFCAEREACAVRYPTEPHRKAHLEALSDGDRLFFCKMFEPR